MGENIPGNEYGQFAIPTEDGPGRRPRAQTYEPTRDIFLRDSLSTRHRSVTRAVRRRHASQCLCAERRGGGGSEWMYQRHHFRREHRVRWRRPSPQQRETLQRGEGSGGIGQLCDHGCRDGLRRGVRRSRTRDTSLLTRCSAASSAAMACQPEWRPVRSADPEASGNCECGEHRRQPESFLGAALTAFDCQAPRRVR
jgi:hypothetical protein